MAKYKIIPSSRTIVQSPISIGHKAEKGVEAIEFDLTAWVETYGSGTLTVIMRRWGDAVPYPIALEIDENNKATWMLSDIDTAKAGMAYAQLNYIVGDEVVKKSDIYTFRVMDSLTGEGEPPEAYESWLEHLTHLAAEAMAEVLDIEGIVTDKTLTVDGGIADAKATGDALSALEDVVTEETDKLKADLDDITSDTENVNISDIGRFYVSAAGVIKPSTENYIGLLEKIPCKPNTSYTVKAFNTNTANNNNYFYMAWYQSDETFISRDSLTIDKDKLYATFTSPSEAALMYFDFTNAKGVPLNDNTSVAISEGTTPLPAYIPPVTAKDELARNLIVVNAGQINSLQAVVENIESEISNGVPSYFESNLTTAVNNIRQNMGVVGVHGDSFVFMTDPHWGINTKHTPKLIRKIISETELTNVVCCGDALDSGTKESELSKAYDFMKSYNFVDGGLKYIFGNHDHNLNQHAKDSSYWLSSEEIYSIYYTKAEKENIDVHCTEGKIKYPTVYCYFDSVATKTRYLNLGMPEGTITQAELTWIDDLLANNPNMNFVLFAHYLFNPSTADFTDGAKSILDIIQNHSNVHAILFGHIHADLVRYSSKGIPIVATDTDAYSRLGSLNPNTATVGTITELAFDNVTVDYRNNDVMCARVGRGKNRYVRGGNVDVETNSTVTLTTAISSAVWSSSDSSIATVNNGVVSGVATGDAVIMADGTDGQEFWHVVVS